MQRRRPSHDKIVKHSAPRRVRTASLRSTINTKSPSAAHFFLSLASDWFTVSHHRPWTPRNLGPSSKQLLPHRREVPISSPRSNAPAPAFRLVGVVPSSHSRTLRLVGVFSGLTGWSSDVPPPISVTEHSWTFSPRLLTTVSGSFGLQSNASSQRFEAKTTRVPNRRAGVTVWG